MHMNKHFASAAALFVLVLCAISIRAYQDDSDSSAAARLSFVTTGKFAAKETLTRSVKQVHTHSFLGDPIYKDDHGTFTVLATVPIPADVDLTQLKTTTGFILNFGVLNRGIILGDDTEFQPGVSTKVHVVKDNFTVG